jgi:hypothetical protein
MSPIGKVLDEILLVQTIGPESEMLAHLIPNIIKLLQDGDNQVKDLAAGTIAVMAAQRTF